MPSEYESITIDDFEAFLHVGKNGKPIPNKDNWKFYRLSLEGVRETVYGMLVAPHLTLRVYSSLEHGAVREKGKDAIRCVLFWRRPDKFVVCAGGSKRVLRIKTWRKNLESRIQNWKSSIGPRCDCGALMTQRKGEKPFYGCLNYPICKNTRKIND